MANAPIIKEFSVGDFHDVKCGILKWPISVIRLESENLNSLTTLAIIFWKFGETTVMKNISFSHRRTDGTLIIR